MPRYHPASSSDRCNFKPSLWCVFKAYRFQVDSRAAMVHAGERRAVIAAMGISPEATHGGAAEYAMLLMEVDWCRRHTWWGWTSRLSMGTTIAVFNCH